MKTINKGDLVISLTNPSNDVSQPRIKGQVYIVVYTRHCSWCRTGLVSLGEPVRSNMGTVRCQCNSILHTGGLCLTEENHFVRLDDPKGIKECLRLAVKNEDYELAVVLRDLIYNTEDSTIK